MIRETEEGERERERERFVVLFIYAFIGWFLYVSWPGIEPTALAFGDDAATNWATQLGLPDSMNGDFRG